ncbi:hypothetical protein SCP_0501530 [Sparassis crispa]|uniref:Complex 1 LYR protein domain-containing protein n=1 Tax=Sparassis crispa TaxID=139825 RepID=A0A401GLP9_9APHY|nr:hypothetical protein SCP_0501530 [Sparassis crispa]GBE83106.1 hypothetical protein SCP_0501530 [Sparassis crispa]
MALPLPTSQSLRLRAHVASLVGTLRLTRLRVSVVELKAHRIPTLWSLYRSLLRDSPTEDIRCEIRAAFRKNKSLRKAAHVRDALAQGHKWAETFAKAKHGDVRLQAVLQRYGRILAVRNEKENWVRIVRQEVAWRNKMKNRPIMTGSYLRPTFYNPPLPRLHPQPIHISGMINSRRRAREKRSQKISELLDWQNDIQNEVRFEQDLLTKATKEGVRFKPVYYQKPQEWELYLNKHLSTLHDAFERDDARAATPYPPEMLERIKEARREKIRNKTRELERERRGVVTKRAMERRRRGPPAHVLANMTPEQRRKDAIARSLSQVGYIAQVKRELGMKFKNPDAWKVEVGSSNDQERLDEAERQIGAENERRRQHSESEWDR